MVGARDPKKGPLGESPSSRTGIGTSRGGVEEDDASEGHPTLVPSFDPTQYAKDTEFRAPAVTITDEVALEQARVASMSSTLPTSPPMRARTPSLADDPDATVEIDEGETELDDLGDDQQIAILRARLAPMSRVPTLTKKLPELGDLLHDPKTAYVLGFVDGILPLDTIVDVTGLPELDTLKVLDRMVHNGVVVFRPSHAFHVRAR